MELGDTIKFLRNQDRKIIEFEDTLEVLRGSYSSLVDEISNLQVLSHQRSMVQEQDDWEERNISESLLAAQQRLAPASNETLEILRMIMKEKRHFGEKSFISFEKMMKSLDLTLMKPGKTKKIA
ncbi:hypothetical protein F8M41_023648 [Gigaspora margarita]|uniref:Uncharacterized protein n=1 Tax=Gigaspora margarita TaxID=4874 RepID=A0A8H4AD38_GIGMA|nr:hypothetical protein F8M41_023648 [Gigaspora margarita]